MVSLIRCCHSGLLVLGMSIAIVPEVRSAHLYWGNVAAGEIRRAKLDGSGQQVLVSGLNDPHRVVLDPEGGQLYWPNFGSGSIQRVNVDGTGHTTLIQGLASPNLLTLDLAGGKIYWSAQGTADIRRANFDGSEPEILIRGQNFPAGIALDVSSGHIYWCNVGSGEILRANLDGTEPQVLVTGQSQPAIITLDLSIPVPLKLQAATTSDAGMTLSWNALMGRAYQVEFKNDLEQTNRRQASRVTATNTTMSLIDPVVTDPHRLYRVILLP